MRYGKSGWWFQLASRVGGDQYQEGLASDISINSLTVDWLINSAGLKIAQLRNTHRVQPSLSSRAVELRPFPKDCYLQQPFPLLDKMDDRILRAIMLWLGGRHGANAAKKQSMDFLHFIDYIQARRPLMTIKLSTWFEENWKLPGLALDEIGLANKLTSGAFQFFKGISISGRPGKYDAQKVKDRLAVRIEQA